MNEVENVVEKWIIGERVTLNAQFIAAESEDKMYWAKCWYMPMRCNVFLRYKGDRHTAAHLRAYTKTADKVTVSGVVGQEFKEVNVRSELWRMITITIEGTNDIRVHSQFDYSHIKPYESEVSKRRRLAEEKKNRNNS
jgi:hypothetical protein